MHQSFQKESWRERLKQSIESYSVVLRDLSLKIHDHPEISNSEVNAHNWISDFLEADGFNVVRSAYGIPTAFLAWYGEPSTAGKDVPTIAFLAEYDALPDIGHACGHNLIAILALAAGLACKHACDLVPNCCIKIIGTPAEETTGGKIQLLEAGAFEDVDIALMGHPGPQDVINGNWLAMQEIRVEFKGIAAHASAAPWEGVNALDAAVSAYVNISNLRQQLSPKDRIHGIITHGGDAPNIIPSRTEMKYYIRSQTLKGLESLRKRATSCFEAAALATGCSLTVTLDPHFADVQSNATLHNLYMQAMKSHGVTFDDDKDFLPRGSTDMGNVSHAVPSIHPLFCIGSQSLPFSYHTKEFASQARGQEAHAATLRAAECMAIVALQCVQSPSLLKAVKSEFDETIRKNS